MKPQTPPSELREAIGDLKPYFARALLFSIVASLLVLAPTLYMLEVYDRVVNSRSHMTLGMLTVLVLWAYVVMEVLEWARGTIMREAGLKFENRLAPRLFDAIFEANLKRMPGGTVQPMNDLRTLREFLGSPVLMAVMEAPTALVFLLIVFMINPSLGWMALTGAVIVTALAWLNERSTLGPLKEANKKAMNAQQYVDGTLRNAEVIESMGMLKDIHRRWLVKQREFLNLQALASDRGAGYQSVSKYTQLVLNSGMLGMGVFLQINGHFQGSGGLMIVASTLGGRILAPLVQVVTMWRSVASAQESWIRMEAFLAAVPAPSPGMPLPAPRGMLTVEGVMAVAPGGNVPIIRNVAFALPPGEMMAVVGPSAAGKTTLARLLIGLWPTAGGKVRLDGVDIFSWNKTELGPHIGYLPQGVELFEGTLAENIARFGDLDMHKVEAAARAVGLHELITALPKGYDTPIGRDGGKLSGGQRQRVALARAIYGDPVFVVLDEPNSSLDEAGDAALAQAITQLKSRGTTFVVMTHRTSVLAVADKMLVLRDGVQQAFGPRDDVLAALNKMAQQAQQPAQRPSAAPALAPTLTPAG
jgi:ATP-binding cassette subfamily C exporter for protease/lipase